MHRNILNNITKLYFIKLAKWFMIFMPIIVLFYQDNGLSTHDVMFLQAVYSISIVIWEIPSGHFADVWGRKKTIIYGSILGCLGFVIYSFSFTFWGFLMAEIILGIGQSFISGSDSAILYDTLLEKKKENEYMKHEGRIISTGNFAEAIAALLGGFLATINLRYPVYGQALVAFIAIPAAIMLIEPQTHIPLKKFKLRNIRKILEVTLLDNVQLRWNIIYSSVIGAATLTMAWFVQPYFKEIDVPIAYFGILWTALNLMVALTSFFAYKIEKSLGMKLTIFLIAISLPFLYISVGFFQAYWAISLLFVFYFIRGIATPVLKDYINRITKSETRATVLSIRNFIIRINFAIIAPFLGFITDRISLSTAFLLAGIIFLILSLISSIYFLKYSSQK